MFQVYINLSSTKIYGISFLVSLMGRIGRREGSQETNHVFCIDSEAVVSGRRGGLEAAGELEGGLLGLRAPRQHPRGALQRIQPLCGVLPCTPGAAAVSPTVSPTIE